MKAAQLALVIAGLLLVPLPFLSAFSFLGAAQRVQEYSAPVPVSGLHDSLQSQLQTELQKNQHAAACQRGILEMKFAVGVMLWSIVILGLLIFAIFQIRKRIYGTAR